MAAVLTAGSTHGRLWERSPSMNLHRALGCLPKVQVTSPEVFRSLALSRDASLAAAIGTSGKLYILHLLHNRFAQISCPGVKSASVETGPLCFAPGRDAIMLATGNSICVIDVHANRPTMTLRGHQRTVINLQADHSRGLALSLSPDAAILWESTDADDGLVRGMCWKRLRSLFSGCSTFTASALGCGGTLGCFDGFAALTSEGCVWLSGGLTESEESCPREVLQLPDVDGKRCIAQCLALGSSCVLLSADPTGGAAGAVPNSACFLMCWSRLCGTAASRKSVRVADARLRVEQVLLREMFCGGKILECAYILHTRGVNVLDVISWRFLASIEVQCCPQSICDVSADGTLVSVLCYGGTLEFQGLSAALAHRRSSRRVLQPQQGPPRLQVVTADRLSGFALASPSVETPPAAGALPESQLLAREEECALTRDPLSLESGASPGQAKPVGELCNFLDRRGSFPEPLRPTAWKLLLQLPRNVETHESLASKGGHPALRNFDDVFPLRGKARIRLLRLLSALAHWAPQLVEVPYLPALLFPITQVFGADDVLAFETAVTLLLNWCCDWLDFFPAPPLGALARVGALLQTADPLLFNHLAACSGCRPNSRNGKSVAGSSVSSEPGPPALMALWPLLQTLLSEVLSRDEWLALWDVLMVRWREPELLGACAVALLRHRRSTLLALPPARPELLDLELRRARAGPSAAKLIAAADRLLAGPKPPHEVAVAVNALCGRFERGALMLPLQPGPSYPPLVMPVSKVGHIVAEHSRLKAKAANASASHAIQKRVRDGMEQLRGAELQLEQQHGNLLMHRESQLANLVLQEENASHTRQSADKEELLSQLARMNQLEAGVDEALQRGRVVLKTETARLTEEVVRRQRTRSVELKCALRREEVLDIEHSAEQQLLARLKECRADAAREHSRRMGELAQRELGLRNSLAEQRCSEEDHCGSARLDVVRAEHEEERRLEANLLRRSGSDSKLGLEKLQQELRLGRAAHLAAGRRSLEMSDVISEEARQLRVRRSNLAVAAEQRAQLLDGCHDCSLELSKKLESKGTICIADPSHKTADDEDALFDAARRNVSAQLLQRAQEDTAAAQADEHDFRAALTELDRIRLAEEMRAP